MSGKNIVHFINITNILQQLDFLYYAYNIRQGFSKYNISANFNCWNAENQLTNNEEMFPRYYMNFSQIINHTMMCYPSLKD